LNSVTGAILSGGKSTRMKTDKAFLKFGSRTMIEELIARLEKKFSKLIIIANDKERYADIGIEVLEDIMPDKGPLGGIYTTLVKSDSLYNFIFSCDTPFVNLDLVDYMITGTNNVDIVVPMWRSRFEPLHAIYSKNCVEAIEKQLKNGDLKITNLFSGLNINVIEQEKLERFDLSETPFMNINTPEDYATIRQI